VNTDKATLHYVALSFLAEHQGAHLEAERALLVDRCIAHLLAKHMISNREAEVITLQALGEYESRKCSAYVDMTLTTSHAVFIREPATARIRVFTVAELIDLVKTPALSSVPVPSTRQMLANGVDEPLSH
jgi:hypothetical protein